jgi:hypothetical protein
MIAIRQKHRAAPSQPSAVMLSYLFGSGSAGLGQGVRERDRRSNPASSTSESVGDDFGGTNNGCGGLIGSRRYR